VLAAHALPAPPSPLAAQAEAIGRCFAHTRMEDILGALSREGTGWAGEVVATLLRMCPFSLKLTLALLRRGHQLPYPQVVTLEYRLAQACVAREDFHEGIRAVLVEKHHQPRWQPATLAEVTDAMVEAAFAPLPPGRELVVGA
jgi:enoyl-CoA hydratase